MRLWNMFIINCAVHQDQCFFFPLLTFQPFCRCNIAVILLTDLIVDHGVKVEWSAYLHLLVHALFIGKLVTC